MPSPNTPDLPGFDLRFESTVVPTGRADGAVMVIPGKPVMMEEEISVKEAARILGCSRRQMQKIAVKLGARQRGKRCKLRIPVREIARLKARRAC